MACLPANAFLTDRKRRAKRKGSQLDGKTHSSESLASHGRVVAHLLLATSLPLRTCVCVCVCVSARSGVPTARSAYFARQGIAHLVCCPRTPPRPSPVPASALTRPWRGGPDTRPTCPPNIHISTNTTKAKRSQKHYWHTRRQTERRGRQDTGERRAADGECTGRTETAARRQHLIVRPV